MKCHQKLIRKILQHAERKATVADPIPAPDIYGYTDVQVHEHIALCEEAGYLQVSNVTSEASGFPTYEIVRLTWKGHQALQKFRKNGAKATYKS